MPLPDDALHPAPLNGENWFRQFPVKSPPLSVVPEALATFQDVYKIDLEKFNSITIASISDSFNRLEEIAAVNKGDTEVTTVDKIAQLHDVFEFTLGPDEWAALANLSETASSTKVK